MRVKGVVCRHHGGGPRRILQVNDVRKAPLQADGLLQVNTICMECCVRSFSLFPRLYRHDTHPTARCRFEEAESHAQVADHLCMRWSWWQTHAFCETREPMSLGGLHRSDASSRHSSVAHGPILCKSLRTFRHYVLRWHEGRECSCMQCAHSLELSRYGARQLELR
jgi:hypothetical protein